MAHVYLKIDVLKEFCEEAFRKFGFSEDEAATITDVLLLSDRYGIESHGMQRLVRYHKGIKNASIFFIFFLFFRFSRHKRGKNGACGGFPTML